MKKLTILTLAACALLFVACGKFGYSAQYRYDVSEEYGTRAILNGHAHDETGPERTAPACDTFYGRPDGFRINASSAGVMDSAV